jgi:Domain of unknown function (DUF4386)
MSKAVAETSPRSHARLTGTVYLLYFLTAVGAGFASPGRPLIHDAVDLVAHAFYIAMTLLFYYLFKPVNRNLSLLAALFSLAGCANDVLSLFNVSPYEINSLVFFGPFCLLIGYLIWISMFLPRILGALMALAGAGWLVFLSPLAIYLSTYLKVLGFVAEVSLMLWLVVMGVNEQRWNERARAAAGQWSQYRRGTGRSA